jgi:hypothetical protein
MGSTDEAIRSEAHLKDFAGTLQADAFAGYAPLYASGKIQEAACWAHVRRKFYDLHQTQASPVAGEALQRIGNLYAIEKAIRGKPPDHRRAERHARAGPLLDDLRMWMQTTLRRPSKKSALAEAPLCPRAMESPGALCEQVEVSIRMRGEPVVVFLVRAVVVENDMDILVRGNIGGDFVQERLEVGTFLGRGRLGADHTGEDLEGGQQVHEQLEQIRRDPRLVRSFLQHPSVTYISDL